MPFLAEIELSAAGLFNEVGLGWVQEAGTVPAGLLEQARRAGLLWVAADGHDRPRGFLAARPLDGALFVVELSVAADRQRQGLGSALLQAALEHAARVGYRQVILTTFRDVPWNAPFYARRGFVELDEAALGPGLAAQLVAEVAFGHDPRRRCAMARTL